MILLACTLLFLIVITYIFYPRTAVATQQTKSQTEHLRERRDVLYENLRDLNFEYRAGKYPEEEYTAQRATLENEAALVVTQITELEDTKGI